MLRFSKICPVSITSVLLTLVGTLPLVLAFPVWPQTYVGKNPHVIVSVFDDARLPAAVLAQAEAKAKRLRAERNAIKAEVAKCLADSWKDEADSLQSRAEKAWLFFNNDFNANAVRNAAMLKQIVRQATSEK